MSTVRLTHSELLLAVAQAYYEQGQTQEEIGKQHHLTRWKVGRMLEEARAEGIVQIRVVHPQARRADLELGLRTRFGVHECVVVPTPDEETEYAHIARAASVWLRTHGDRIRTLGVSWGNTLQEVAAVLPHGWTRGIEVIQVNGGISRSVRPTTAANVAQSIAHSGDGRATLLPVPAIVEQVSTRDALYGENFVRDVLASARAADALLFSLGVLGPRSVLVQSGAVTAEEVHRLREAGAVGDALGHYVRVDGTIADDDIESRTIGLTLDDLRAHQRSVAIAAGAAKSRIITAALASGLCSVLITDEAAARAVLES